MMGRHDGRGGLRLEKVYNPFFPVAASLQQL